MIFDHPQYFDQVFFGQLLSLIANLFFPLEMDSVKRMEMANEIESLEVQLQEERSRLDVGSAKMAALGDDLQLASKKADLAEKALRDAHEAGVKLQDACNRADALEMELEAARRQASDNVSAQAEATHLRDEHQALKVRAERKAISPLSLC